MGDMAGAGKVPTVMEVNGVDVQGRPAQALVVKTKGGNMLQVSRDEAGRLYFVDMKGNLYYDSGIKEVGFYFVRPQFCFPLVAATTVLDMCTIQRHFCSHCDAVISFLWLLVWVL
jgi:hypothetical protein